MSRIEVSHLTKKFGSFTALDDVSVNFEEHKIYGLLGRNGAGKSTLINVISNRMFPTSGEVKIDGEISTENDKALSKIYCMSDRNLYNDEMKIKNVFKITKQYYPEFDMDYACKLADKFQLDVNKKIKTLSTGYNSIYKMITAISANASVVFFDEPVLGLDANHREMFYKELIEKYSDGNSTYVISTHIIEEISKILEHIVVIKNGKIIMDDETENIMTQGYSVSGTISMVDSYCSGKRLLGEDVLGGLKTAYILENADKYAGDNSGLEFSKLDLQKLFIHLTD